MKPVGSPRDSKADQIRADLILLHAPSVFDFRAHDDILFAYLSDSDSVNVTSIYEMFPLGFFSIKQHLQQHGFAAEIVNIASLMLMHNDLNVDKLLGRLQAPLFGLDLHWMAHCQGAIEVAYRLKAIHPDSLVMFGGISATYFADELIRYRCVDLVVQGYDTLMPVTRIVQSIRRGSRDFKAIPNVLFKDGEEAVSTGFTYRPASNYNDTATDWSFYQSTKSDADATKLLMTLPNTGCAMDCNWCGGSRFAIRNIMNVENTLIRKNLDRIIDELRSMGSAAKETSVYALQCYSETRSRLERYLECIAEMGYKSVSFEQYHLPDQALLEKMGSATRAYIMLSPESHNREISRLAGRGNYSMAEMEEWIPRALDAGIVGIMVWFFIGMPKQTPRSVMETVDYCEKLLERFPGRQVIPLICPMVPFLDPGSRFFENPRVNGYRVFHRTLEEHRRAMVEPLWYRRLNYETKWMTRRQLQDVSYEAVSRLVRVKAGLGYLPRSVARSIVSTIDETTLLLDEIERALDLGGVLPLDLRDEIGGYNRKILSCSTDQIIPLKRPFGGRWFDDHTVPPEIISACEELP